MDNAAASTLQPPVESPPLAAAPGHHVAPVAPEAFTSHRVARLRHDFQGHPLMQMPELARLARDLMPTRQCRFVKPGMTPSAAFDHQPLDPAGRDIDEVFRRIEEPGSWVALYNVETQPRYRAFLEEVTACVRPFIEREQPGMFSVGGFIFISAPPSVTPFHIDRENNFWLQMKGRKSLHVWDPEDREVVAAADVDRFIVYGSLENVRLRDEHVERCTRFDVGPGEGVYFPSTSPHATRTEASWVSPGDGVSVSIGVVFYTRHTRRMAYVHALNLFLRSLGLDPVHPGRSRWRDALKYPVGRTLVWARRRFRGYQPRVGF
jgi:hypothetical protein